MRVLILGPVVNEHTSGGVAVFDEGLCHGFSNIGDTVNIVSLEKSSSIENMILSSKSHKPFFVFFRLRKIASLIKAFKPDLVISSLHYSLGIKLYKRKWKKAKYVHVVHGTPCSINGKIKAWCVNLANRYARKHFDKLVTVSHLSWSINKKINRVECDEIINVGCSINSISPIHNDHKLYDFCYIGRLYRDKNIEKMMDALVLLHDRLPQIKVCVVGYGEKEILFQKGNKYDYDFIEYKGKMKQSEIPQIYYNSKFFISLCELEACGTAFFEAALNGCNPVSSLSSGQTQYFIGKNFYHSIDASNVNSLYLNLCDLVNQYVQINEKDIKDLRDMVDYKNVAMRYKKMFFN